MLETEVSIQEYLSQETIAFLDTTNQREAIEILIDKLAQQGKVKDPSTFLEAILKREETLSTGIGMGIAIPHAKMEQCDDFFIAIGILSGSGIDWKSIDGLEVKIIFLIGGPKGLHQEHLTLLSKLTQTIKDAKTRQGLLQAKSPEEVIKLLEKR